ncbi:MAG: hypothetical protein H6713_31360 [Myxococcales bacterium]|nr:hypothetical protein [Myxococcales bacterium]
MECTYCHANNEGLRSLCSVCGRVIERGAIVALRGPERVEDAERWDVRADLVRAAKLGAGLSAIVEPARSTRVLLTSKPVFDDLAIEVKAQVTSDQEDKAAGFALDVRVQGRSLYRAEALLSGWYRINRVDEGASTVLARIKALDRAITSPRILRLEARGDRLRLAVDGELLLSLRDDRHRFGAARVVAIPGDHETINLEWSALSIVAPA